MRKGAIVLGTFDGLHKGHMAVLGLANEFSPKTVITFDFPPAMDECKELLMLPGEKNEALERLGFSIETLDFSKVHPIPAEEFLQRMDEKYHPEAICCGFNYRFGYCGKGGVDTIKEFCAARGIKVLIADAVSATDVRISSSFIRELIKRGEMEKANAMLSAPFSVSGEVSHGDSRGRTMGTPTVNFFYPEDLVAARHGVYAASVLVDGREYAAVCYIGNRPTFHLERCICETNLLDFSGNLYGKRLKIGLLSFLREDKQFSSLDELKNQIQTDIINAKKHLS